MKKLLLTLGKFFGICFSLYTCTSFGLLLLNRIFSVNEAPDWTGVIRLFLQVLLFSALSALFITLLDLPKKLESAVRELLKFVLCFGAFFLAFVLLVQTDNGKINVIILSTIFTVLYAFVAFASAGIKALLRKGDKGKEAEYEPVFGNNTVDPSGR